MKFLFVDDEVKVLEGLERSLMMVADDDWDMEFVEGGAAAVERLKTEQYDALVTDMRMPGIDGAEVLRQAQALAPSTARVVLSGQMEDASALKALERAHQILSKPCNPEALCGVLRSVVRYRTLLERESFRRAVVSTDRLPAAPTIYREIEAELSGREPSLERLAAIAARDPGLTARLVQVSNSPFFGGGRRITTASQAIGRLGLRVLAALAVAAVFDRRDFPAREFDVGAVQSRALRTAEIAGRLWPKDAGLAYLAGILTEVGHLVVASTLPREYDAAMLRRRAGESLHDDIERECWGATHAEIGAYLLALWGMPTAVVDAVGHHHSPVFAGEQADPALSAAVACAAAVVENAPLHADDLRRLGMSEDEIRRKAEG